MEGRPTARRNTHIQSRRNRESNPRTRCSSGTKPDVPLTGQRPSGACTKGTRATANKTRTVVSQSDLRLTATVHTCRSSVCVCVCVCVCGPAPTTPKHTSGWLASLQWCQQLIDSPIYWQAALLHAALPSVLLNTVCTGEHDNSHGFEPRPTDRIP
jgi:hypothetical protein